MIVGDNLRTDILAGFQAGLETILVHTVDIVERRNTRKHQNRLQTRL
ncbi:HAD hydrolase-like protein [Escherichia sp. R-CC3]